MKKMGKFYGVGVGPGEPDLISVKAVKVLNSVSVIYAAHSPKNSYSLAKEIISHHVNKDIPIVRLDFPMTRKKEELTDAWKRNARRIYSTLSEGQDAAFVTLGDPMVYSTFGYIMRYIMKLAPGLEIDIIPGISSYQAAAALSKTVLAEAEGSFSVISAAMGAGKLKELMGRTDTVVMLKVYKHYKEIWSALKELNLQHSSVLIMRCGLEGEKVVYPAMGYNGEEPPYLSTLIIRKRDEHTE